MAEPTLPTIDEQIAAVRRTRPVNDAEARSRSRELIRLHRIKAAGEREAVDADVEKRIESGANGSANDPASGVATEALSDEVIATISSAICGYVDKTLAPLIMDIVELKRRVFPIVGKFRQVDVWEDQRLCSAGDTVAHDGHAWRCLRSCHGVKPGLSPVTWHQLNDQRHA